MSKPPPIPRRVASPTQSFSSLLSHGSSVDSQKDEEQGGASVLLRELYDSFEPADVFSQFENAEGRGQQTVLQTLGLLHQIWANRNVNDPSTCFDRHDRRSGLKIYSTPKRGPGGVIIPCKLLCEPRDGSNETQDGRQTINIINNNVVLSSSNMTSNDVTMTDVTGHAAHPQHVTTQHPRRRIQMTFKKDKGKMQHPKTPVRKRENKGRFSKKNIIPVGDKRHTAPSIPMRVKGLRRLLKQFVVGDPERSLSIPLSQFSVTQRNGRDCNGKTNKQIYSRRRKVALATLLALQDAVENHVSFSVSLGLSGREKNLDKLKMTDWEKISSTFLQRSTRSMGDKDLIALGQKMYRKEYLELLPKCEE